MSPPFCLVPSSGSRSGPLSLVFRPQLPAQRQRGVVPHCFLRAHAEGPTPWGRRSRRAGPKVPRAARSGAEDPARRGRRSRKAGSKVPATRRPKVPHGGAAPPQWRYARPHRRSISLSAFRATGPENIRSSSFHQGFTQKPPLAIHLGVFRLPAATCSGHWSRFSGIPGVPGYSVH